ncbi:MAG TPA: T9SS type A sorting domain-containing protein [Flavobacteriales bacterium]|nr:T9SS type A sorting domain-containing protein [Flavobacteriales bacterium]
MKNSVLTIACMGLVASAFGQQKEVGTALPMHKPAQLLSQNRDADTLYSPLFDDESTSFVLYNAVSGANQDPAGFVFGTNTYGDKRKGRAFLSSGPTAVTGVLFWFGAAYDSGNNSNLIVDVHAMNGNGFVSGATDPVPTSEAPGAVLGSTTLPMSEIQAGSSFVLSVAEFATPVGVNDYFGVSMNMTGLVPLDNSGTPGDSLGLVTTQEGEFEYPDFSWEQWSNNEWYSIAAAWGIDLDPVIFVAVDDAYVGINDESSFNGMRLSFLNGNPFKGDVLQLGYTTEKSVNLQVVVAEATGRVVLNKQVGSVGAGLHNLDLDASNWSTGSYFVTLIANGKPITKKVAKL